MALLTNRVDPNSSDSKGHSVLWYAAYWGRGELICELVRRGARLPDDVLMGPVNDRDIETIRFLIRHGANVNCVASFTRYTKFSALKKVLLTEAIGGACSEEVSQRCDDLRSSSNSNQRAGTKKKQSEKDMEAVPLMLIKAGANVNRLAFEYSFHQGFIRTLLGLAAHHGYVKTVKAMLVAGANVNQKDTWGGTALLDAAAGGHDDVVRILLAAGAKPNIKRRDGYTPVSIAREQGFVELAAKIERNIYA